MREARGFAEFSQQHLVSGSTGTRPKQPDAIAWADLRVWPNAEPPSMSDVRSTADSVSLSMKFVSDRPFADPDVAARKIIELANAFEPVQDGRRRGFEQRLQNLVIESHSDSHVASAMDEYAEARGTAIWVM